jgi:hypothetical protein
LRRRLATNDVNVSIPNPDMGRKSVLVARSGTIVKDGGNASAAQHPLCSEALLETKGAPWDPAGAGQQRPADAPYDLRPLIRRRGRSTRAQFGEAADPAEGQDCDCCRCEAKGCHRLDENDAVSPIQPP